MGLLVQSQLERTLFSIMEQAGFGAEYVNRYKMVSAFFRQRRPLIVQLCGAPCTGEALCLINEGCIADQPVAEAKS